MKLLSLFDGSGGFPLAAAICGIEPVMASEIEPYPIAVTRSRFPNMMHLGDVSSVDGSKIEPVDVISFGSPCQDLSVAGTRHGLLHKEKGDVETTRSGLFIEAIRIIREMREATNGRYPRIALWENVPGAFSSNKGEDFRVVLEEFVKIIEPYAEMPPAENGRWPYADVIVGDGWSIAYRTLDSQYWGIPQRRRRIYLVADFGSERAGEILFKRKGLRRYFEESGEEGEAAPGNTSYRSGKTGGEDECMKAYLLKIRGGVEVDSYGKKAGKGPLVQEEVSATIGTSQDQYLFQPVTFEPGVATREGGHIYDGICGTIRANPGDNQMSVAYAVENHPNDSRCRIDESGKCQSLTTRMGTGGNNVPLVLERMINPSVVCLEGNGSRPSHRGNGYSETDKMYTLNTTEVHSVCYGICSYDSNAMKSSNPHSGIYEAETSRTIDMNGGNPTCQQGGIVIVQSKKTHDDSR